jgi:hypothetical protein
MRYRDPNGQDWADIIDMVTKYPGARQRESCGWWLRSTPPTADDRSSLAASPVVVVTVEAELVTARTKASTSTSVSARIGAAPTRSA